MLGSSPRTMNFNGSCAAVRGSGSAWLGEKAGEGAWAPTGAARYKGVSKTTAAINVVAATFSFIVGSRASNLREVLGAPDVLKSRDSSTTTLNSRKKMPRH